ncbi:cardiolipin synthase [Amnibacterium setariae]|uniref:Cardiolipin synthase n=1 Tax=Amnibacterium setariae TaxID=2306585 RepID=A0A3A1U557_9MICO|nr:cardiolipin synthase [Amnibacterium setariae]RIX30158.1 cardiolipin synthase [Amnibacterium setariae]
MLDWIAGALPGAVLLAIEGALLLIALAVAPRGRRPSSALAWILLIVVLPLVGLALFGLIGSPKLPKARRDKQRTMNERIEERSRAVEAVADTHAAPRWLAPIARLNRSVGAMPLIDGNAAELLPHFEEQLAALIQALDAAERYAHVEFYIVALDDTTRPFFAALERAVARGVEVRLLVDHLGSFKYPGFRRARKELTRIGVEWRLMLPVQPFRGRYQRPDLRNHRKLMVVDGTVAFVGSMNVIDPGYETWSNRRRRLRWRDLMVEVRGPIVQEVEAIFATDWFSETDQIPATTTVDAVANDDDPNTLLAQIAPSGPAFESENNLALFNSLIYAAEHRISITSPYFVPDESLLGAILTAARRGVDVELFVGEIGDQFFVFHAQHSYYRDLLEAGVRIYEYAAPTILHAKHMSVDDRVAVVGSSNMDIRSFQLDLELMMLVEGVAFTDALRRVEDEYRSRSKRIALEAWAGRSPFHAFIDGIARLTSAVQ